MRMFDTRSPRSNGLNLTVAVKIQRDKPGNGSHLLELVSWNVDQDCSDPRDYIFGLLGLTVWSKRRHRFPRLIQPSYVKSVSDCMRDATRVMLQQEGELSALLDWCQVGQSPTWAVHWHRHKEISSYLRPVWSHANKITTLSSLDPVPLDLDLMEENPDLNVLLLAGLPVSIVHLTTSPLIMDDDAADGEGPAALEIVLRHILDLSIRTGFKFSSRTITLTLMGCGYASSTRITASSTQIIESEGFPILEHFVGNLWDEFQGQRSERRLDLGIPISWGFIIAQFSCVYRNCRLFTTRAGQLYVGSGRGPRRRQGCSTLRSGLPSPSPTKTIVVYLCRGGLH
jgi:hypothetical protein